MGHEFQILSDILVLYHLSFFCGFLSISQHVNMTLKPQIETAEQLAAHQRSAKQHVGCGATPVRIRPRPNPSAANNNSLPAFDR